MNTITAQLLALITTHGRDRVLDTWDVRFESSGKRTTWIPDRERAPLAAALEELVQAYGFAEVGATLLAVAAAPTPSVLDLLTNLDAAAMQLPQHGIKQLWHLLSALRGPDADMSADIITLKRETTAIIRAAVLPRLARSVGAVVKDVDPRLHELPANVHAIGGEHFAGHVADAFDTLHQLLPKLPTADEQLAAILASTLPSGENLAAVRAQLAALLKDYPKVANKPAFHEWVLQHAVDLL